MLFKKYWGVMRMTRAMDIRSYSFHSDDKLFLDTNILLYVYGPFSGKIQPRVEKYSLEMSRIRAGRCATFVDVLVISEFINRFSRHEWERMPCKERVSFKDFRGTTLFKPVAEEIADNIRSILGFCNRIGSEFDKIDINSSMSHFEQGNSDFNDEIIAEICKRNSLILITDDSDFKDYDIQILTANRKLLAD